MENPGQRPIVRRGPRSLVCSTPCRVSFKNLTDAPVKLFWIDYRGRKKFYGILGPVTRGQSGFVVNTFVTHPWLAEDSVSGTRVRMNFKQLFYTPAPHHVVPEAERSGMWTYLRRDNPKEAASETEKNTDNTERVEEIADSSEEPLSSQNHDQTGPSENPYEVLLTKKIFSLELLSSLVICQNVAKEDLPNLPLPAILTRALQAVYHKWYS